MTIVQNSFVIVVQSILVEIMALVIHKTTTPVSVVPVAISTVVITVRSAISIVPMIHVMDMVTVQTVLVYHLVTSVIVTLDSLVLIVK